jgi:DNA-binding response OmpR family regulator
MTVTWQGMPCPLGHTRLLALMERIARNLNRWIPYDRLKWDVWHNESRSDGAIKVTVTRLRRQLPRHRMEGLAAMATAQHPRPA